MPALRHTAWILMTAAVGVAVAAPSPALVEAARRGRTEAVRTLLREKSADANAAAVDGTTALHWAAHRDDAGLVAMLIRAGANPRAADRYGVQPLALAAVNGNAAILSLLLEAGADPNVGLSPGETALMLAARTGKLDALKVLHAHGAALDTRNERGQTALMWAAAGNNAAAVRWLVEMGADIGVRTSLPPAEGRGAALGVFTSPPPTGFTALLFAVRAGNIEATRALLDAGANVNDSLSDGQSALVVAAANAHWELAAMLLDRGADPNASGAGWNALHQTIRSRRPSLGYAPGPVATGTVDSIDVIRKMIARGVDVDARMMKNGMKDGQNFRVNRLGATAFFLAAKNTDLDVMKVLADAGASARIPNADGTTPLMVAAGLAIWSVGADGGSLPGQEEEVLEAVKMCVALGNDVNATNAGGETPMHGAAYRGVNRVIEFLAEQGAKLDARDVRGWTPFTIATGLSFGDMFKQQPQAAALLKTMVEARGLSTEGQAADGSECFDCLGTHADQAAAALERDRRMEADFARSEAERLHATGRK